MRNAFNGIQFQFQCAYVSCPAGYSFKYPAPLSTCSVCNSNSSSAAQKFKVHGAGGSIENAKCNWNKGYTTCFLGLLFEFGWDLCVKEVH